MKNKVKIVKKPWGSEVWFASHKNYLGKVLRIIKGHRLSRQYHRRKHETLYCVKGECVFELNGKKLLLKVGDSVCVLPGTVHRISAQKNTVELFEVSTCHPEDVVRLDDDYGRK